MVVYSHSRINTFFQCPLKFKFKYLEKPNVELKQGIEAFMGSRVHETLEYLYKLVQHTKIPSEKELINYYEKQWVKNWNENIVIVKEGLKPIHYHDLGIKCVKNYYSKHFPFDSGNVLGIEKRVKIKLGNYLIQGYIDRLDEVKPGYFEIHDYKTYSNLPSKEKIEEDTQLALYAIGLRQEFENIKSIELVWHLVVFGKELRTKKTLKQLTELKKEYIKKIKQIESAKKFPTKKSVLCNWCSFQNICPEFKHEKEIEELSPSKFLKEKGVTLTNKYIELKNKETELKNKLNELKQIIISYAEKKGYSILEGSDGVLSIKTTTTLKLPKKETKQYLKLEKLIKKINKYNELSSLNQTKIKKYLEKKPNKKIEKLLEENKMTIIRVGKK